MGNLKSERMSMNRPDYKVKGGPVPKGAKTKTLGSEHKVKGFTLNGPDKSGGGWPGKAK